MPVAGTNYAADIFAARAKDPNADVRDLLLARKYKIDNDPNAAQYKGDALYQEAEALLAPQTNTPMPTITRTPLKSAEELARLYGNITFDEDAIRQKFDAATSAEYARKRKEYEQTEDQFYNRLFGTQSTALDTIRRANASAISSGAAKGMQAANELSAILGLQQESVDDSTKLAQERNLLMDKEAEAYTKNVVDALAKANEIKLALGTLGSNIYASDTQFDVGTMQYLAQLDAAAKQLEGMGLSANATKYSADRNLEGSKYTADQNLIGSQYTADQNLAGTQYTANKNYASNIYAANQNLAGTKYAADANREATIKAAELNNAAQTAYYNHLASQPELTLQDAVIKAINDGYDSIAVSLIIQATGVSKKDAEKMVQDLKEQLSTPSSSTLPSPTTFPRPWEDYLTPSAAGTYQNPDGSWRFGK
jgi:hypothetical protein